jgi:sugar lactone lactonase YvrE
VFDRSSPLPTGGHLEQADGIAWMTFLSQRMFQVAIVLALHDTIYEDLSTVAGKVTSLYQVEFPHPNTRFNDGKCDAQERF